jgi:hypothetical protein
MTGKRIIEDIKIMVELPEKVLNNLDKVGYLDVYHSFNGDNVIISGISRKTLNKTITDMIIKEWGY